MSSDSLKTQRYSVHSDVKRKAVNPLKKMEQLCLSNDFNLQNKQLIRVLCMYLSEHITFCFFVLLIFDFVGRLRRSGRTELFMKIELFKKAVLFFIIIIIVVVVIWS